MPVETADDRLIMLTDFGQSVSYTHNKLTTTITAIFDNQFVEVDSGGEVGFAIQQPRLTCRTSDVSECVEGDSFVISGTTYLSRIVQDDGTGMTMIVLEKQ
jgi:hypothetical protein